MKLNDLVKITAKKAKRVGRGHGSGKGKTSARGYKGQKSRGTIAPSFEGGQLRLIKRLPFVRGVGNPSHQPESVVVNVGQLANLESGSRVDRKLLLEKKLITASQANKNVKILGSGELSVALQILLPVSKRAKEKIEKALGKTETKE